MLDRAVQAGKARSVVTDANVRRIRLGPDFDFDPARARVAARLSCGLADDQQDLLSQRPRNDRVGRENTAARMAPPLPPDLGEHGLAVRHEIEVTAIRGTFLYLVNEA